MWSRGHTRRHSGHGHDGPITQTYVMGKEHICDPHCGIGYERIPMGGFAGYGNMPEW